MTESDAALRAALVDDLAADIPDEASIPPAEREDYLKLIEKRVRTYTPKMVAGFDPKKSKKNPENQQKIFSSSPTVLSWKILGFRLGAKFGPNCITQFLKAGERLFSRFSHI